MRDPGPAVVRNPESGIELHWQNGEGTLDEAQARAERRCAKRGLHAELVAEFLDRDETLARFDCR